ncbi:MAG: hypothetical protein UCH28_07360 [Adlercreutzia sp.]|nr:hypothetical protein [Adlercreutzia sp.]
MPFCPQCGGEIVAKGQRCPHCGYRKEVSTTKEAELPEGVEPPVHDALDLPADRITPANEPKHQPKSKRWLLLAIAGALLVIACVIGSLCAAGLIQLPLEGSHSAVTTQQNVSAEAESTSIDDDAIAAIAGHWQGYAAGVAGQDLKILGAGAPDSFYLQINEDGSFSASIDGDPEKGSWQPVEERDGFYWLTFGPGKWIASITQLDDVGDALVVTYSKDSDYTLVYIR